MDSNATEKLKKLVTESGKSLAEISVNSGVPYQILWRFVKGLTVSFDVNHAERLHLYLTGNSFSIGA